jgi:hypothetical protein
MGAEYFGGSTMEGWPELTYTEQDIALMQLKRHPHYMEMPRRLKWWALKGTTAVAHSYPTLEMAKWFEENIRSTFWFDSSIGIPYTQPRYIFADRRDAVRFKMVWG